MEKVKLDEMLMFRTYEDSVKRLHEIANSKGMELSTYLRVEIMKRLAEYEKEKQKHD